MTQLGTIGTFLRARRATVHPRDVGLPAGPGRQVAGLRREEVAVLAAISTDYYVQLEQDRVESPSLSVLDALGRALRLDEPARAYLHALASPAGAEPVLRAAPPDDVRAAAIVVRGWAAGPALLVTTDLTVLTTNDAAPAYFPGLLAGHNLARRVFIDNVRDHVVDDLEHERCLVGSLRRASARGHGNEVSDVITELMHFDRFRNHWERFEVHEKRSGSKWFRGPGGVSELMRQLVLEPTGAEQLNIWLYSR